MMVQLPLVRFPHFYRGRKPVLDGASVERLLLNLHIVEEKLDGSQVTEPYPAEENYLLILEDMLYKHGVFYDKLPARYILVDVINKDTGGRLFYDGRVEISRLTGYPLPPLKYHYAFKHACLARAFLSAMARNHFQQVAISEWGSLPAEGFVIKLEIDPFLGGKFSRLEDLGTHWTRKPVKKNWIRPTG